MIRSSLTSAIAEVSATHATELPPVFLFRFPNFPFHFPNKPRPAALTSPTLSYNSPLYDSLYRLT